MTRPVFGKRSLATLTVAVAAAIASFAPIGRADHPEEVLPGHSAHGDTFDEGPRRAAPDMPGTGDVHLPISTKSSAAQKFFDQGLGQLHGFWYLESERSFRQAAALDPDCPMVYWGMAMANKTNPKRARSFIGEAVERLPKAKLTKLERGWIELVADYYSVPLQPAQPQSAKPEAKPAAPAAKAEVKSDAKPDPKKAEADAAKAKADAEKAKADAEKAAKADPKSDSKKKKAFLDGLAKLREQFPNDLELKAFSALYIWEFKQTSDNKTADKLLDEIFAADADHPAHHYRIHLCDGKRAKEAIVSAATNGPAAPGIAHMWHMPGHTYSSLQRYADAAWQQEASARVDHAYMIRDRVMPFQIHNYAHNNEWLIRDLLMVGRVRDGIDLAKNMVELPRHPKYGASTNRGSGGEYGHTRLIDALSQHQMWTEYLQLCDSPYIPADEGNKEYQVRRLRFKGVAHAALGQEAEAKKTIDALTAMKTKPTTPEKKPEPAKTSEPQKKSEPDKNLEGEKKSEPVKASDQKAASETKPQTAAKSDAKDEKPATKPAAVASAATKPAAPATASRRRPGTDPNKSIDQAIAHINGELAVAARDYDKALKLLATAGIRQDHLSQVQFASGDQKKALETAKKAVDSAKGQTYPLANYVNLLVAAGKTDEARTAFDQLQELAWAVDLDVEPYKSVGKAAKELGVKKKDWRAPYVPAKDLGQRPPLDDLGPFRWHPSPAPAWSAPAADGSAINLDSYKGKPVVVIFYLGYGCLHCTQQLQAFAPLARQYQEAGISLVAISTDNREALHKAWEAAKVDGDFPFPLVADPDMQIFKRYHCFDDFENSPLHGTFLIDGDGQIRWQDISAEPFMDGSFLLKEAKRLMTAG